MTGKGTLTSMMLTLAASAGMVTVTAMLVTVVGFGALRWKNGSADVMADLRALQPIGTMRSLSASADGWLDLAHLVPRGLGRFETVSVLDAPTAREREKARVTYRLFGGAVVLPLLR